MSIRILGLGGSRAAHSTSLRALELALESATASGADVELLDLRRFELPLYDPALPEAPPAARHLAELASQADGLIWSSPTYHGAMSGALKNALDWLQLLAQHDPPYITDKPVGLIATAAGSRGMQTINTMAATVQGLRGWALPFCVTIGTSYEAFTPAGAPRDPAMAAQIAKLGRSVVDFAERFAGRAQPAAPRVTQRDSALVNSGRSR